VCEKWGGNLVHIADVQEQHSLMKVKGGNTDPVWIGLGKYTKEETWRWVTQEPLTFTFWDKEEPSDSSTRDSDCAVATGTDGRWMALGCHIQAGFVCERHLTEKTKVQTNEWECETKQTFGKYVVSYEPKRWSDAQNQCATWKGNLVSIHNDQDHDEIS